MKNFLTLKKKLAIVISLLIIVVGMAMLGIFGFGQAIDYKDGYQVTVSVDQDIDGSATKAKEAAEKYFADNGLGYEAYSTQCSDSGTEYIFKLKCVSSDIDSVLKTKVEEAVNSSERVISVKTTTYKGQISSDILPLSIALAITVVAFFLYEFFTEKAAAAFTNLLVAVISGLLFVALLAITRIPALPYASTTACASVLFGSVLSAVMINRFKEIAKLYGNDKKSSFEITAEGAKQSVTRFAVVFCAIMVAAVAFAVFGGYMTFLGLQIMLVALSSTFAAYVGTPIVYSLIKK